MAGGIMPSTRIRPSVKNPMTKFVSRIRTALVSLQQSVLMTTLVPLVAAGAMLAAAISPAQAQVPAPQIAARSWLLIDMTTHTVLYSQLPDERVEPASLTKLMTAYVVFDGLKQKRVTLE